MTDFLQISMEEATELLERHLEPYKVHEGCGGNVIQEPVLSVLPKLGKAIIDAVRCDKCNIRAGKCALYKRQDACTNKRHS